MVIDSYGKFSLIASFMCQVLSVKAGFWDSMYQNFLEAADATSGLLKEKNRTVQVVAPIDVGVSKEKILSKAPESPGV